MRSILILALCSSCGARSPLDRGDETDAGTPRRADGGRLDVPRPEPDASESCEPCIGASQNASGAPYEGCAHGLMWLAWEWIPECDFIVDSISLRTRSGGRVALFADSAGQPGDVLLMADLGGPDRDGWRRGYDSSAFVSTGTRYWIGEQTLDCSLAATGTPISYWGSSSVDGPWSGPYMDETHIWSAKIGAYCD